MAILTKIDLAVAVEFDGQAAHGNIQAVRPGRRLFEVSAKIGEGVQQLLEVFAARLLEQRPAAAV